MTFVDILAAGREARRVVDGAVADQDTDSWCGASSDAAGQVGLALTAGDLLECETYEERCTETKRRIRPRIIGQDVVEYAMVVVLVAIGVILLLGTVGHQAQDLFSNLSRGLAT